MQPIYEIGRALMAEARVTERQGVDNEGQLEVRIVRREGGYTRGRTRRPSRWQPWDQLNDLEVHLLARLDWRPQEPKHPLVLLAEQAPDA